MISGNAFSCAERHVYEVDVHTVDLGDVLRERVQPLRDAPEVVLVQPVATEGPQSCELDALRAVGNELVAWPARRGNAPAQIVELLFGNVNVEAADVGGGAHESPSVDGATRVGAIEPRADFCLRYRRRRPVGQWVALAGAKKSMSSWLTRSGSS